MSHKAALSSPLEDKTAQEKREELKGLVAEMRQRNIHIAKFRANYTKKCAILTQHRNILADNMTSFGGVRDIDMITFDDKDTESYRSIDNEDSFRNTGSFVGHSENSINHIQQAPQRANVRLSKQDEAVDDPN